MEKNIFYHNENNKYMQYHSYEKYSTFRWSEFVALVSLSTTFFLFLHSRDLTIQLSQEKLRHQDEDDTGQQGIVFGGSNMKLLPLTPILYFLVTVLQASG